MPLYSYSHLSRRKKYQERKKKYSPSDAAMTNNEENRNAIEMKTLANPVALQHDTEDPTSAPVPMTGASTTTASSATTTTTTVAAENATSAMMDPFDFSEDQIKSSRGLFSFSRVTGSFSRKRKK